MNCIGVVEDINDPQEMGRVRVRLVGKHNEFLAELPLNQLPWTPVLNGISLEPSDWVLASQVSADEYVILGKVNGVSNTRFLPNQGFYDPNESLPRNTIQDHPQQARIDYKRSSSYVSKVATRRVNVPIAVSGSWSQPSIETTNAPVYPNNEVKVSKNGHSLEVDDTPQYERISLYHSSGTYTEMQAKGDRVSVITGSDYEIIIKDKDVYIEGSCNVTVMGDSTLLVKGNHTMEVEGNYSLDVKGDMNTHVNGQLNTNVVGDSNLINAGKTKIQAARIDLN